MADVYKFKVKLRELEDYIWRDIEITSVSTVAKLVYAILAAVEAVKQESMKKMKLFSSDGKADMGKTTSTADVDMITKLVIEEVKKYLNK